MPLAIENHALIGGCHRHSSEEGERPASVASVSA